MRRRWQELESGRISDILKSKAYFEQLVEFHWQYYSELAFQRNQIREQLKSCLREKACPFQCSRWQRVVKYRYSLSPLSTKGSLVDPGGRFNVGEIDRTRYPVFPALYLACDKGNGSCGGAWARGRCRALNPRRTRSHQAGLNHSYICQL